MIAIGKIFHRFQSFVDDTYTCFVGTDRNFLDILGRLPMQLKLGIDLFCSFNGGLGMELRWIESEPVLRLVDQRVIPG